MEKTYTPFSTPYFRGCLFSLTACLITTAALLVALPAQVFASSNAQEEECRTDAYGPVPPFEDQCLWEEWDERVYFHRSYPLFGIDWLDNIIREELSLYITSEDVPSSHSDVKKDEYGQVMAMERSFSCTLHAPQNGLLSIEFSSWSYTYQMSHGHWLTWAQSYDLEQKRPLKLKDLFEDWEKTEKVFTELVIKSFIESFADQPEEEAQQLMEVYRQIMPDNLSETYSFIMDSDGISFIVGGLPISMWMYSMTTVEREALEEAGIRLRCWTGANDEKQSGSR
jgi:Protein of unknown function (DUF3298).